MKNMKEIEGNRRKCASANRNVSSVSHVTTRQPYHASQFNITHSSVHASLHWKVKRLWGRHWKGCV